MQSEILNIDQYFIQQRLISCIPALRRYAESLTKTRDSGDDLVQETLERAIRKIHLYQPTGSLTAWLCTIMRRLFFDHCRRAKGDLAEPADDLMLQSLPGKPASQEDRIMLNSVWAAVEGLSREQQEIVSLVAVEGMTYEQAAQHLSVPVGTVRSRLSRARKALQAKLDTPPTATVPEIAMAPPHPPIAAAPLGVAAVPLEPAGDDLPAQLRHARSRPVALEAGNGRLLVEIEALRVEARLRLRAPDTANEALRATVDEPAAVPPPHPVLR